MRIKLLFSGRSHLISPERLKLPPRLLLWTIYAVIAGTALAFSGTALEWVAGPSESQVRLAAFRLALSVGLGAPVLLSLLRRRLTRHVGSAPADRLPRWLSPASAFVALAAAAALGGLATFELGRSGVSRTVTRHLEAVAKLKAQLIESWVRDMADDSGLFVTHPEFVALLRRWHDAGRNDDAARAQLRDVMTWMSKTGHFRDVSLLDATTGASLLATNGGDIEPVRDGAIQAARTGRLRFEDFHVEQGRSEATMVGCFVPIKGIGGPAPRYVLHLTVDPTHSLFPLIQQWSGASPSGELLLMRRDGDEWVMLNELRVRRDTTQLPRVPVSRAGFFAARLAKGEAGTLQGVDDDDTPVLGYGLAVAGTPWFLAAKLDRAEAYEELVTVTLLVGSGVGALLLAGAWWWVEQQRRLEAEMRVQLERRMFGNRIDFLARFANDCIVRCDADGNILEINDRCLVTYGYAADEILAMNLIDLRAEATRAQLPETLRTLAARGSLVYETEHRRKDGRTFPVEVSARLIDVDGVRSLQEIIRDVSERKAAGARILDLTRLHATISAVNQAIVRGRDLDDVFVQVCRACVQHGRFRLAWVGLAEPLAETIACRARNGAGAGYLDEITVRTGAGDDSRSEPSAAAFRDQRTFVCNDLAAYAPAEEWRLAAARHNLNAAIALPLHSGREVIGVLTAYADAVESLGDEEAELLGEMAQNLSFALEHFAQEQMRIQAEQALRLSEVRLRQAQVVGKIGDWSFDHRTRRLSGSAEARRLLRLASPEGTDLGRALAHYPREALGSIRGAYRKVLRTRQRVEIEVPFLVADGQRAFHSVVMIPDAPGRGRVDQVLGTIQDITERKRFELERSEHLRRLAELSHRVVSVQEQERRRLSRDLHDRTGASLATVNLNLKVIDESLARDTAAARELLAETRALLADTIVNIREFCADLRPAVLDYAGLVPALKSLANQFERHTGAAAEVAHEEFALPCSAEIESLLFRIAQEALANCAKHAMADTVGIRLANRGARGTLTIEDDGCGFDPDSLGRDGAAGHGLLNMRERAELAGALFRLTSRPGEGTRIEVEFDATARVI